MKIREIRRGNSGNSLTLLLLFIFLFISVLQDHAILHRPYLRVPAFTNETNRVLVHLIFLIDDLRKCSPSSTNRWPKVPTLCRALTPTPFGLSKMEFSPSILALCTLTLSLSTSAPPVSWPIPSRRKTLSSRGIFITFLLFLHFFWGKPIAFVSVFSDCFFIFYVFSGSDC